MDPSSSATDSDEQTSKKIKVEASVNARTGEEITFEIVTNDGTDNSCLKLIALKNIFSRQLPKMPKEYIVRLVFDHRHISIAIVRSGRIIGGICYRPYYEQRFGEIAFCAINSNEQVKGYGSILMNQLKTHVQKDKLEYFLTYADNFAIGYFQKQGFSKHVAMPKERWVGFIKDYDGGTLMECYIHPGMDYLNVPLIVAKQRAFILQRLSSSTQSDTVYPGLQLFKEGKRLQNVLEVPGVNAAGWNSYQLYKGSSERDRNLTQTKLNTQLKNYLDRIRGSDFAWPFTSANKESDYGEKIKNPIDLSIIHARLKLNDYYRSKEALGADLMLMIRNCKEYFGDGTDVFQIASELEKIIIEIFGEHNKHQPSAVGVAATAGGAVSEVGGAIPSSMSHGSLNNASVKNSSVGSV